PASRASRCMYSAPPWTFTPSAAIVGLAIQSRRRATVSSFPLSTTRCNAPRFGVVASAAPGIIAMGASAAAPCMSARRLVPFVSSVMDCPSLAGTKAREEGGVYNYGVRVFRPALHGSFFDPGLIGVQRVVVLAHFLDLAVDDLEQHEVLVVVA